MTTLAGSKIRRYREAQTPRLTRTAFGERFGAGHSTVQGWEEEGKIPRDAATLRRLALTGICSLEDWYRPVLCPRCELAGDDPRLELCRIAGCPMAAAQVA